MGGKWLSCLPGSHLCVGSGPVADPRDPTPLKDLVDIPLEVISVEGLKSGANVRAGELWEGQPCLILVMRRPGDYMCRQEALDIWTNRLAFQDRGIRLICILLENIPSEVEAFKPKYWRGDLFLDLTKGFYKALGGGRLIKGSVGGYVMNPKTLRNRALSTRRPCDGNYIGHGLIKGGLFMVRQGDSGVAYQFLEKYFGDRAPMDTLFRVAEEIEEDVFLTPREYGFAPTPYFAASGDMEFYDFRDVPAEQEAVVIK